MLYKAHYQQANHILNDIAFLITSEITENGGQAIPIPASQILDWGQLTAHLSHREIAYKAGLGWRGRNNLLVAEKYGAKVRLVTLITDLEFEIDKPMDRDCGGCYNCCQPSLLINLNSNDLSAELRLDTVCSKCKSSSKHQNSSTHIEELLRHGYLLYRLSIDTGT